MKGALKMEKKKNGFLVIPQEIMESLENQEITLSEAVVLSLIKSFTNNNKSFYMSNATLAKKLNLGLSTVKRVLKKLESKRLIVVEATENARFIKLCSQITEPEQPPIEPEEQSTFQDPLPPASSEEPEQTQTRGSSEWTTPCPETSPKWTGGSSKWTTINTYTNTNINTSINTSSSSLPSSTDATQNKNKEEEEEVRLEMNENEFVAKALEIDNVCSEEDHVDLYRLCIEKGIDHKDALLTLQNAKDSSKILPCHYLIGSLKKSGHLPLCQVITTDNTDSKARINYETIKARQDIQSELCYKFGFEDSEARDFGDDNGWDKVGRNLRYVKEKYKASEWTKYLIQQAAKKDWQGQYQEGVENAVVDKYRKSKRGAYGAWRYSDEAYEHIYV